MKTLIYGLSIVLIFILFIPNFGCKAQPESKEGTNNLDRPSPEMIKEMMDNREDHRILVEEATREYITHVPSKYTGSEPVPIVVMLHGTGGDGEKFWKISGWKEKAEKEGFIAVFPSALKYCYIEEENGVQVKKNKTKWLSPKIIEILCTGQKVRDDVVFLNAMLDALEANYSIDPARIYFSGFSNGGGFCRSNVLTEMNDRVASIATMGGLAPEVMKVNGEILSVFAMMGELDPKLMPNIGNQPIPTTEADFFANATMAGVVDVALETLQLNDNHTAVEKTKHFTLNYKESAIGQDNELFVSVVKGLQHRYPNGKNNPEGVVAVDIFWPFFLKHSK